MLDASVMAVRILKRGFFFDFDLECADLDIVLLYINRRGQSKVIETGTCLLNGAIFKGTKEFLWN